MYTIIDLCFICLKNNKNLKSILSLANDGVFVKEKLKFFLLDLENMEVENLKHICLPCFEKLNNVCKFKQLCVRNIAKLNGYINTLKNTEESCENLQITLIDLKNLKEKTVKPEIESDSESIIENFSLDNSKDYTETELEVVHTQQTEVGEGIIPKQNKEEHEYIVDNNKYKEINVLKEQAMIQDDEPKYEFIDDISKEETKDNIFDDIVTKTELGSNSKDNLISGTTNNAETASTSDEKPHKCSVCNKSFKRRTDLQRHFHIHTGDGPRPFKCKHCDLSFRQQHILLAHIRRKHTGEKPYKCDVCSRAFVKNWDLTLHKRLHTGERPYVCDICDKTFVSTSNLIAHKRVHTGDKSYECEICGEKFWQTDVLFKHVREHTEERPYKCSVCNKSYKQREALRIHKFIHSEKKFKCEVCNKEFHRSGDLSTHKRLHTAERPHKCDVCGVSFKKKKTLLQHQVLHTEKAFKCDVCNREFRRLNDLVMHKRQHTGEMPHKCDICGKAFSRTSSLVTHRNTHSKKKQLDTPEKSDINIPFAEKPADTLVKSNTNVTLAEKQLDIPVKSDINVTFAEKPLDAQVESNTNLTFSVKYFTLQPVPIVKYKDIHNEDK